MWCNSWFISLASNVGQWNNKMDGDFNWGHKWTLISRVSCLYDESSHFNHLVLRYACCYCWWIQYSIPLDQQNEWIRHLESLIRLTLTKRNGLRWMYSWTKVVFGMQDDLALHYPYRQFNSFSVFDKSEYNSDERFFLWVYILTSTKTNEEKQFIQKHLFLSQESCCLSPSSLHRYQASSLPWIEMFLFVSPRNQFTNESLNAELGPLWSYIYRRLPTAINVYSFLCVMCLLATSSISVVCFGDCK